MSKVLVFDDERMIRLMAEVRQHPKLISRIEKALEEGDKAHATVFDLQEDDDIPLIRNFEELIGFLAAECGVALHGDYSHEDIWQLCDHMREKFEEKRTVIVNSPIILLN